MADKTIVKKPLITEKASSLGAFNQYVFLVADGAAAPEIKKVIEQMYKVKVSSVRTINIPEKKKRFGRGVSVKAGYRKAVVTLKKGEKIDILTA